MLIGGVAVGVGVIVCVAVTVGLGWEVDVGDGVMGGLAVVRGKTVAVAATEVAAAAGSFLTLVQAHATNIRIIANNNPIRMWLDILLPLGWWF
jgi:hypothetical protein